MKYLTFIRHSESHSPAVALPPPEAGSLSFMLSKEGYLSDDAAGPWLPHVMFFVPHGEAVPWGAEMAAAKPPFVYSIVAASRGDK